MATPGDESLLNYLSGLLDAPAAWGSGMLSGLSDTALAGSLNPFVENYIVNNRFTQAAPQAYGVGRDNWIDFLGWLSGLGAGATAAPVLGPAAVPAGYGAKALVSGATSAAMAAADMRRRQAELDPREILTKSYIDMAASMVPVPKLIAPIASPTGRAAAGYGVTEGLNMAGNQVNDFFSPMENWARQQQIKNSPLSPDPLQILITQPFPVW